ncbi:MAG: hypothetical protein ABL949_12285 [Fimbriimonadaceae bacterium]
MSNLVRTFAVTPGAHTILRLLESLVKGSEETRLTSFSSSRLRQLRGLHLDSKSLEIVEFGKIVGEVVEVRGGPGGFLPSSGLIEAAIAEACASLTEDDPLFKVARLGGAHRVIAKNWDMLRAYGVEIDSLQHDEKQRSVAGILEDTRAMLTQLGRRFNSDAMRVCLDLEPEPLPFSRVICVAASEFKPAELAWLRWLQTQDVAVDIIVETHASEPDFFFASNLTASKFGEAKPVSDSNPLSSALFSKGRSQVALFDVSVLDCPDELAESEWVLRDIAERCESQDWSKVAIFCRGIERYGPILEAVSIRLGVPLTLSRQMPLLSTATAKTLLAVLRAASSSDVRSLSQINRHARLPEVALTEIQAQEATLAEMCRRAVTEPDPWGTVSALLAAQEMPILWLRAILDWRAEYLGPANLATWRERLIELARHEAIQAILEPDPMSQREGNAVTALLRTLAQVASIDRLRSRRELSLSAFTATCQRLWSEGEVTLEGSQGGVSVVNSTEAIGLIDHLYVMGTVEGVFPRRRQEDPLFTDADLQKIVGTDPLPDSFARARLEREEFYRACCSPRSGLTFTFPRTGGEHESVSAFYLEEVLKAVGKTKDAIRRISPRDLTPADPKLPADVELKQAFGMHTKPLPITLGTEAAKFVRRNSVDRLSVRELNQALVCPFRWFASSRLKVQPNRDQYRWRKLIDIPMEVNLTGIGDRGVAQSVLSQAAEMKLAELFGESSPHDLSLMRAGVQRLIAEWIEREFVAREAWGSASNIRVRAHSTESPFRSKIKLRDGQTIELEFQAPIVSRRGDFDVAHLFTSRDPIEPTKDRGHDAPPWEFTEQSSLEILSLLLMRSDRTRGTAVEIDHRDGRRLIHFPSAGLPARRNENVIPHALDSRQDHVSELVNKVEEAVAIVCEPSILPRPGDACNFCDFGELCRRHIQFPEDTGEPFE